MFLFKHKTRLTDTNFFNDFVDFHTHILPGVDDGVRTLEEALVVLEYFESLGVKRVILTPHIMNELSNNRESINKSFDILCEEYNGNIELNLGAEYMLDSGFEQHFESGLQYLYKDRVLVETSYMSPPNNLYEKLYNISVSGDTPVIAHPERYLYMRYNDYHRLKNNEYLFQLNLLSLTGYYGKRVKSNAEYLLEEEMYDVIGTDLHHIDPFKIWIKRLKITSTQLKILTKIAKNSF